MADAANQEVRGQKSEVSDEPHLTSDLRPLTPLGYCISQDRYFKLMGDDGNLYILRLDEGRSEWELILFQSPHYRELSADIRAGKERGDGVKM